MCQFCGDDCFELERVASNKKAKCPNCKTGEGIHEERCQECSSTVILCDCGYVFKVK